MQETLDHVRGILQQVQEENKILKEAIEEIYYFVSLRDPQINTHKQAADAVEEIARKIMRREQ